MDLKNIFIELNFIINSIEKDPLKEISTSILLFERCLSLIKNINEFSPSNQLDILMTKSAFSFNKAKIEKLNKFTASAKLNLINVAELHSYLYDSHPYFMLASLDFSSDNLEKEVLKLIIPLSNKTDHEIATYIREALELLKKRV